MVTGLRSGRNLAGFHRLLRGFDLSEVHLRVRRTEQGAKALYLLNKAIQGKVAELINSGQVTYAAARKELQGDVTGPSEEELKARA